MIKNSKNEILNLTKKLIAFKTVNGNGKEIALCFDFIKKYFEVEIVSKKIIVKEYKKNGVLSLALSNRNTLKPDIIFNGHIDVVNAEDKLFTPVVKNGKLYGRGAADMKNQVATMMAVLKDLINSEFKKSISLILNSDEEMGGCNGVKYLVEEIGYRAKVAIIPDGSYNFDIVEKQKGGFWIKFVSHGKSAHASRFWLGENAILKLTDFYGDLIKIFPPLKKTKLLYQDGVSINLGKINGGKSTNSVPETAEMHLDLRYSEKMDKRRILESIKKLSKKHKISFEITDDVAMLETSPKNYYLKMFKNVVEKNLGRKVKIVKETGASDARFFSKYNIPVIITVPNCGGFHEAGEWAEIKSLEKFYEVLREFVEKAARG